MDWDKLRIFHAAADAGSFTHAGEVLGLSQSAVSRQVSALEADLDVPLFHRHARGLILTEQGEMLMRTVKDVVQKLESAKSRLTDSRKKPNGELKITTTLGIGTNWLAPRLGEFLELYPDIRLKVILSLGRQDVLLRTRLPLRDQSGVRGSVVHPIKLVLLGDHQASVRTWGYPIHRINADNREFV